MQVIYENFPFFCIFLSIIVGILSAVMKSGRVAYCATLLTAGAVTIMSALLLFHLVRLNYSYTFTMGKFPAPFGNAIKVGPLQALFATVFPAVMILSLLGGKRDLFHDVLPQKQPFYFVMVNMLLASLLAFSYTNDIFTGYVFIEISTIAACAMVMAKDTGPNLIATIRYLFMSLLGSGLFLIGVTLLNSITGYLLMPSLHLAVMDLAATGNYRMVLTVAIMMIVIGLGVKSAMFPFHRWLPGAHGGATTASSAILSGLVLKGYIVLMIVLIVRVFTLGLLVELHIADVILVCGLLGMIVGSLMAIREHHIKRMLAYSSVAQIGYIFMGIGIGTEAGIMAACFHILVHACCKPLLFSCAGRLSALSGHHKNFKNLRGSAYRCVTAGVGFTVGALSMIGIPLFGGFVSKLYLANASLSSSLMPLNLFVIAVSTLLNALYYVPAMLAIWVKPPEETEARILADIPPEALTYDRFFASSAIVLILLIFVLGIFYHPITSVIYAGIRLL